MKYKIFYFIFAEKEYAIQNLFFFQYEIKPSNQFPILYQKSGNIYKQI